MKLKLKEFRRKELGKKTKSHNFLCPWSQLDPKTQEVKKSGVLKFSQVGQEHEVPDAVGHSILAKFSDILEIGAGSTKRASAPANK